MLTSFLKYASVGVLNTAIHWTTFFIFYAGMGMPQSWSNVSAFAIAVTFSFFANARLTFNAETSPKRFALYFGSLGLIAYSIGGLTDYLALPAVVALVTFSAISLITGYACSRFLVFR
jgi:putative flippase GtrA